jgi:type II secretory pathway component PulF
MDSPTSQSPGRFAVLSATAHGAVWLVFGIVMIGVIPRFLQTFREWRFAVPSHTELVLSASQWMVSFWFLLVPALVLFFAVDAGILFRLRRNSVTQTPSTLWSMFMLAVPLVLTVFALGAVMLPLTKADWEIGGAIDDRI